MKFNLMVSSFALLTMVGCTNIFEDNDTKLDGSVPYVTTVAPNHNYPYQTDAPFKIESIFTDKDGFEMIDVKMVKLGDNVRGSISSLNFQKFPEGKSFKLDTTLAANTLEPGEYQLLIKSVDKRKNEGTTELRVFMQ